MIKPTFEQCLDHIEVTIGLRLLDWQKELLRDCYDNRGKELYISFHRHYGIKKYYEAKELLDKLLNKDNDNG